MKKIISFAVAVLLAVSLFTGCQKNKSSGDTESSTDLTSSASPVEVDFSESDADMFTERDS